MLRMGVQDPVQMVEQALRGGVVVSHLDPVQDIGGGVDGDLDPVRQAPVGPGALQARLHGSAEVVPDGQADLAIMMGHVAQYFVDDADWAELLANAHRLLRPGGHLAFETRNPVHDWAAQWTRDAK